MWLLFFSVLFAGSGFDQNHSEYYGEIPLNYAEAESLSDHDYDWLYEVLLPEAIRHLEAERTFKSFRVHLKDTYKAFPHPDLIQRSGLQELDYVEGKITYVGFFKKWYRYDVLHDSDGTLVLRVKVFFKNASQNDLPHFDQRLAEATEIWNSSRPELDFSYRFLFERAQSSSDAHFSVRVTDKTRGPYDTVWGRSWSSRTIAHEMGHMLGLGDEYKTISGEIDCFEGSIMCSSFKGEMMEHHYYFVLRRLVGER